MRFSSLQVAHDQAGSHASCINGILMLVLLYSALYCGNNAVT